MKIRLLFLLALAACGPAETPSTNTTITNTVDTAGTVAMTETATSSTAQPTATITPGTTAVAPTATATIAPEPAPRTTTSAPPGTTEIR